MKKIIQYIVLLILIQACVKKDTPPDPEPADFRDPYVGTYLCDGVTADFQGTNRRNLYGIEQHVEKYLDSCLIIKYSLRRAPGEDIDTVRIYSGYSYPGYMDFDNHILYSNHENWVSGQFRHDTFLIGYSYGGRLNPGWTYFLKGTKI